MINRCKHNPCCGDQTYCSRPLGGWPEELTTVATPIIPDDELLAYIVALLQERGEPTAARRLSEWSALSPSPQPVAEAVDEPLAFGVLDMDGECLHSVHIFRDAAEKAAFGLGRAVPLGISPQAHPNMGMEHIGWAVQDSDGSWSLKAGKAMPTGIRLTLLKPVYVRKESGE